MAAVTICSDFGAQENEIWQFSLFPHLFAMKWWDQMPWSSFSEYWVLSQLFHSPLSLSSRGSLVPLRFLHKSAVICRSEVISPGNLDSSLCFIQMYSAYKLNKQVTIYSLDLLLSQFGTSLFFHVQFSLLLLDLHTDFSGGRSGGLVFPSV